MDRNSPRPLTKEDVFDLATRVSLGKWILPDGSMVSLQAEWKGGKWWLQGFPGGFGNVFYMDKNTGVFKYKGNCPYDSLDEILTAYNEWLLPGKATFEGLHE